MINYTFQDLTGSFLAVLLFSIVLLIPGYLIGWWLDVFEFRKRHIVTQHVIGVVLSNAIIPITLFLLYRFISATFALICLLLCLIGYIILLGQKIRQRTIPVTTVPSKRDSILHSVIITGIVIVLAIALLVDIQIEDRLYYSTASYDLTTRVAIVDAITRTGVPPINPGYYPGHPVQLTYLYYFWYILGSVIDCAGGELVSAYHSMIGSIAWSGITLMSALALYLRLRTTRTESGHFQLPFISAQLVLVGGLDFIPIMMAIIQERTMFGRLPYNGHLEGWNTPIMTWANALVWVPHHVAATLACLTAMMVIIYGWKGDLKKKAVLSILAGFAFASAFGLSVWIMFTFAIFWAVWAVFLIFQKEKWNLIPSMVLAGILSVILVYPFLMGILKVGDASTSSSGLPIAFYVRPFMAIVYFDFLPRLARLLLNFLFLPLNYFFEFGFFLLMAILWIRSYKNSGSERTLYQEAELILVITVTILLTFVYSTVIEINDLGIRGWLPLQFVLIVWAVDILAPMLNKNPMIRPVIFKSFTETKSLGSLLTIVFIIGLLSSGTDMLTVRFWPMLVDKNIVGFPNELSPDTKLGERTYAARLTYDYIREYVPETVIIQSNPLTVLDRPGGLYGDHQMAIADRSIYGVSAEEFTRMSQGIGNLFNRKNISNWDVVDEVCNEFSINVIVVNDTDPLWSSINNLERERSSLYKNDNYAVFTCGK